MGRKRSLFGSKWEFEGIKIERRSRKIRDEAEAKWLLWHWVG
jgi:hypothetical protein